ncbi:uncharacterized protein LOC134563842 isoform X2 [Prinia subflava]|uniref:uncharacterized protein LOC134563842 isoform X2 n=1 Tax=Prinia subflava TaxID=208062 RepID=UPI002FDFF90A
MLLRSGRRKPYQMPLCRRQSVEKQFLLTNMRSPPGNPGNSYLSDKTDIAWLSVFTSNEAAVTDKRLVGKKGVEVPEQYSTVTVPESPNLVILRQRSKLNEFVQLCTGKKHLSLKVVRCPSVEESNMKTYSHEDPDFKQLSEDNYFFIMHDQGDSVQFQCYEDRSYYLYVNDDSLDIRKLENKEPNEDKNFYFRVSYLQEK